MVNNEPPNPQSETVSGAQPAPDDLSGADHAPAGDEDSLQASMGDTGAENDSANEPVVDVVAITQALRDELEQAKAENEAQREQALRAVAEAENVRRRAQRDLENAHKFALERFVNELLPVKDSLELGLAAALERERQIIEPMGTVRDTGHRKRIRKSERWKHRILTPLVDYPLVGEFLGNTHLAAVERVQRIHHRFPRDPLGGGIDAGDIVKNISNGSGEVGI